MLFPKKQTKIIIEKWIFTNVKILFLIVSTYCFLLFTWHVSHRNNACFVVWKLYHSKRKQNIARRPSSMVSFGTSIHMWYFISNFTVGQMWVEGGENFLWKWRIVSNKKKLEGYNSMIKCLPSMHDTLDSIASPVKMRKLVNWLGKKKLILIIRWFVQGSGNGLIEKGNITVYVLLHTICMKCLKAGEKTTGYMLAMQI